MTTEGDLEVRLRRTQRLAVFAVGFGIAGIVTAIHSVHESLSAEERLAALEAVVTELQARADDLESAKEDLDNKVDALETRANDVEIVLDEVATKLHI